MNEPRPIRVLVLDDDQDLLVLTTSFLSLSGQLKVDTTASPERALELVASKRYDAFVSDYEMTGMNGIEVLRRVRSFSDLPFILFTGRGRESVVIEALNSGADFYLQKGTDPSSLFRELEHMIVQGVERHRFKAQLQESNEEMASALEELRSTEDDLLERNRELNAKEAELKESLDRYHELFMKLVVGCALAVPKRDDEGNLTDLLITEVNPSFERLNLIAKEALIGRTIRDVFPHQDEDHLALMFKVMSEGSSVTFEQHLASSDRYLDVSVFRPQKDQVAVTFQDITERRQLDNARAESEELIRSIMNSAPDGLTLYDKDGRITFYSKKMKELLALPDDEDHTGDSIFDWVDPADVVKAKKAVEARVNGKKTGLQDQTFRMRRSDGTTFTAEVNTAPFFDSQGRLRGLVASMRDITDLKRQDEAFQRANQKLNLLSSVTRHDMLNQLTVLQGRLELAMGCTDVSEMRVHLDKLSLAANNIARQLVFTREYQDIGVNAPEWIKPEAAMAYVRGLLAPANIKVENTCKGYEVYVDPLFNKVLYTFLDNTMRYGKKATRMAMTCHREGDDLVLIVEDDGIGIPQQEKVKIFEKGYGRGTGFGLFLAKEILAITGATIRENGEESRGAKFEVQFSRGQWRKA